MRSGWAAGTGPGWDQGSASAPTAPRALGLRSPLPAPGGSPGSSRGGEMLNPDLGPKSGSGAPKAPAAGAGASRAPPGGDRDRDPAAPRCPSPLSQGFCCHLPAHRGSAARPRGPRRAAGSWPRELPGPGASQPSQAKALIRLERLCHLLTDASLRNNERLAGPGWVSPTPMSPSGLLLLLPPVLVPSTPVPTQHPGQGYTPPAMFPTPAGCCEVAGPPGDTARTVRDRRGTCTVAHSSVHPLPPCMAP